MTGFMQWTSLSEVQVIELESNTDEREIKRLLVEFFRLEEWSPKKQNILCNFHFYNYAFCKETAFDAKKTSTFMSIMNDTLLRESSTSSYKATMSGRFQAFQDLLIKHSVERPPKSVQIFTPADVKKIVDYALESYFKKYRLYQYIFDTLFVTSLKQVAPNQVEYPALVASMNGCVEIPKVVVEEAPAV